MSGSRWLRRFSPLLFFFTPYVSASGLLDVYRLALQSDQTFLAARYKFESAQEVLPQARAGLLPTVSLRGGSSNSKGNYQFGDSPNERRDISARNWTVELTHPILRMQNWQAYSQSGALVERARAELALAEQELILRVTRVYFDADLARQGIRAAEAQLLALDQQLRVSRRGLELGTHSSIEVYEVKARYDRAHAELIRTKNELSSKQIEVDKLTRPSIIDANNLAPIEVSVSPPQPDSVEHWISIGQERAYELRALAAAVSAAEFTLSKTQAEYLPTMDLTMSYGGSSSSGSATTAVNLSNNIQSSSVGVQLNVPIYSGGGITSRVRSSLANLNQARAELEAARRDVSTRVQQAFSGVTNGIAEVAALEAAVESGRSSAIANRAGYRLGTRSIVDVLNADQLLYSVQRDLIKARYEQLQQAFRLKASIGALTEEDLTLIANQGRIVN